LPITWGRRHWRGQMHSYRFSAARLRAEAREAELNQAIVDLSREDFLAGNFDLKSLFSVLFDRFYSEDFVLWLGAEEMIGRTAAFKRMADVLELINTLLEKLGLPSCLFAQLRAPGRRGELHHRLGNRFRRNVFDRHGGSLALGSGMEESHGHRGTRRGSTMAEAMSHSMMHMSMLAREELRIFEGLVPRFDSLSKARVKCGGSDGTRTRDLLRDRQAF
jgi:hypothetical protein